MAIQMNYLAIIEEITAYSHPICMAIISKFILCGKKISRAQESIRCTIFLGLAGYKKLLNIFRK